MKSNVSSAALHITTDSNLLQSQPDMRFAKYLPCEAIHLSYICCHKIRNFILSDIVDCNNCAYCSEFNVLFYCGLTHWGRVTHICVVKLTIIGSDNGLSPGRRQAIIWTNVGILLIGPLGKNFDEILIGIQTFSFKKTHLKMSSAKWRPFCLGLNVLISVGFIHIVHVFFTHHWKLCKYTYPSETW